MQNQQLLKSNNKKAINIHNQPITEWAGKLAMTIGTTNQTFNQNQQHS